MVESRGDPSALKKAEEHIKNARAELKTGLFKWSANYASAAIQYEKAAKLLQKGGYKQKAIETYLSYSECSEKANDYLTAGEALTEAASMTEDRAQALKWLA